MSMSPNERVVQDASSNTSNANHDKAVIASVPRTAYYRNQEPWVSTLWDNTVLLGTQLLYSGGSAALARTSVAPLERVKIVLQVQSMQATPGQPKYRGLWDALSRIPKESGGWQALYRGNGVNCLRLVPDVAFKFMLYEQFKTMFSPTDGSPQGTSDRVAAAAAAGTSKLLLFYPLDLCRVRITADIGRPGERQFSGLTQCLRSTLQQEGVMGLYRGLGIGLVSVVPNLSITMYTYDELKSMLPTDKQVKTSWWYPIMKMGCGGLASLLGQAITYPLDTLQRRMQVNGIPGSTQVHHSYMECLMHVMRQDGVMGLYRGCLANCLKIMPGAAVQFMAYDLIKTSIQMLHPTTGVSSPL